MLAHSCMLRFFVKSARVQFLFDSLHSFAAQLQQSFEEAWVPVALSHALSSALTHGNTTNNINTTAAAAAATAAAAAAATTSSNNNSHNNSHNNNNHSSSNSLAFPLVEVRAAVRDLLLRTKDYLVSVQVTTCDYVCVRCMWLWLWLWL